MVVSPCEILCLIHLADGVSVKHACFIRPIRIFDIYFVHNAQYK